MVFHIVAEGGENKLKEFIEALETKHPAARVENLIVKWRDAEREFRDFEIRR